MKRKKCVFSARQRLANLHTTIGTPLRKIDIYYVTLEGKLHENQQEIVRKEKNSECLEH